MYVFQEYLRREVKPTTKDQLLINGINQFWRTVTVTKCLKYIGHPKKVIPKMIMVKLQASRHMYMNGN